MKQWVIHASVMAVCLANLAYGFATEAPPVQVAAWSVAAAGWFLVARNAYLNGI